MHLIFELSFKYAYRIKNTESKVLRNISLELFYSGEKIYPKTKNIARTNENVTFGNTISSSCAKPQEDQEHTDGEMTP